MTEKGKMMNAIYAACLTKRATLIIFYLINRADQALTCFPGVKTIATECNVSPRTVQRALNDLEEAGFLKRESRFHDKGGQRSNLYRLKNVEIITDIHEVDFEELNNQDRQEVKLVEVTDYSKKVDGMKIKKFFSLSLSALNRLKSALFRLLSWGE
jgi:predicted transcriptional regulator